MLTEIIFLSILTNLILIIITSYSVLNLRRSREILRESEARERDFLSVSSHQLLTPIAILQGYISMLLDGKLGKVDRNAKKYLRESLKGVGRMSDLVKLLLMVSRVEGGKIKVDKSEFDLYGLTREVTHELEPRRSLKGIVIKFKKRDLNKKKLVVSADLEHTRQVLTNVLDNAIKYTDRGLINVTGHTENRFGYVTISDTGRGIDQEALPHIFEKFYFGRDKSTYFGKNKPVGESHGIGLYTSRLLLGLMDGTVEASSEKGKGSKFIIGLPLAK